MALTSGHSASDPSPWPKTRGAGGERKVGELGINLISTIQLNFIERSVHFKVLSDC